VTVQGADVGDTTSLVETAIMAAEQIEAASAAGGAPTALAEIVAIAAITAIRRWSICTR
jgi:hypothetical protein